MPEWSSYTLSDFLLFSPRTYFRLFELYNAALWPIHVAALVLGLAIIVLAARGGPAAQRVIAGALSLCWFWVAWAFLHQRYAAINWAADYAAIAFGVEAGLLALLALRPQAWSKTSIFGPAAWVGIGLLSFAVIPQPLFGPLLGRPWSQVQMFGLAPDPTVVATLGVLLIGRARGQWTLMVIPVLWCLIGGATLWAMGQPDAIVLPVVATIAIATYFIGRRRNFDMSDSQESKSKYRS
jgi:hypothetical protein